MANIICGVDVSAKTLDARIGLKGPVARFRRTPEGIAELRTFCAEHGVELVVMEATGGYERELASVALPLAQAALRGFPSEYGEHKVLFPR